MLGLVVSPHPDDAVLSCFALLLNGWKVVTVFAGLAPPGPAGWWDRGTGFESANAATFARQLEDEDALALTGTQMTRLEYVDCQYADRTRRPSCEEVAGALRGSVNGVEALALPRGLGRHPDHLLARGAGEVLASQCHLPVVYYGEYPFSRAFLKACGNGDAMRQVVLSRGCAYSRQRKVTAIRCYRSQLTTSAVGDLRSGTSAALGDEVYWIASLMGVEREDLVRNSW